MNHPHPKSHDRLIEVDREFYAKKVCDTCGLHLGTRRVNVKTIKPSR